jgi:hypothetical protein
LRATFEPDPTDPIGLLDTTRARLLAGTELSATIDALADGLWRIRRIRRSDEWYDLIQVIRAHPVMGLLQENPFIRTACMLPGLTSNGRLLDLLLRGRRAGDARDASRLGLRLLERDRHASFGLAIRERHQFLTEIIDDLAEATTMPHILAVGAGLCREALTSRSGSDGRLGRVVSFGPRDQALAEWAAELAHSPLQIESLDESFTALLEGSLCPSSFHLIYAPSVYQDVPSLMARDLTRSLFALLKPGGRLLISNFVTDIYDAAYLEACADFRIAYRNACQMLELADHISAEQCAFRRVYTRYSQDIFYLELRMPGVLGP